MTHLKHSVIILFFIFCTHIALGQKNIKGKVQNAGTGIAIPAATVTDKKSGINTVTNNNGDFSLTLSGDTLLISSVGYTEQLFFVNDDNYIVINLVETERENEEVVITGTMKPMYKSESPVAVEVYTQQFFKKNPTPSLFESLQNVNGVRPQINCSVCNTGDIHINGLEGPYTMVTIDGMPIVSSLATVYGLFGIPSQLIERVEIVKGPASGLYGSEAIGGLINVITKEPGKAPLLSANLLATGWGEYTLDIGGKIKVSDKVSSLLGINYHNYQNPIDKNNDGFTDVTLQHRISVFNKYSFKRNKNRVMNMAARYFYEDRWGGEMNWSRKYRGGEEVYGESIYTNRWELIGNYQLPIDSEKITFSFSATGHDQNSFYGSTSYAAKQHIGFAQMVWDKRLGQSHSLLTGVAARYNYYDDNSPATYNVLTNKNAPDKYILPGIFVQDEWAVAKKHLLLMGLRWDYHKSHGNIFTPRFAWKWSPNNNNIIRVNAGTGFRVVNLFTEDHAALTGARDVVIENELKPERSYNVNLNYTKNIAWNHNRLNIDASTWYSYFTNQIIPDYDTDPQKIIYDNLNGHAVSKGVSLNLELSVANKWKAIIGGTIQDVYQAEKEAVTNKLVKEKQMLTESWSGTWTISRSFPAIGMAIDYTGNVYGPMRLPVLSDLDPRPDKSSVWSIQNIQISKTIGTGWELFGGVKNLLNWTPAKGIPFLIARTNDPFDKNVDFDTNGNPIVTPGNPYALTFDPAYVYAPNQGRRLFVGVRVMVK